MIENATKASLDRGELVVGCFDPFRDADLAEYLALQGWDFVLFDGEHGPLAAADFSSLSRAVEVRGVTPIGRVPANQPHVILQALDAGLHGVHVPWINSAAEAEAVVRAAKYAPDGDRGLAGVRAGDWGMTEPLGDYTARANRETLVVIHVETRTAVENIDELVAVAGIDVFFLGPNDLANSYGVAGQIDHPAVQDAMEQVAAAVLGAGRHLGVMAKSHEWAERWRERGATYITTAIGALIRPTSLDYLATLRG